MKSKTIAIVLVSFLLVFIAAELFVMGTKPPQMAEAWFSEIAYNGNPEYNDRMANDIPWGATSSQGVGKTFFVTLTLQGAADKAAIQRVKVPP